MIFVADPDAWTGRARLGQILMAPVSGGPVTAVRGAEGRGATGIEVVAEGGQEVIYFTGHSADGSVRGVYKIAVGGAEAPTAVAEGHPLIRPEAVAITRGGTVYVSDRGAYPNAGSVWKIERGVVSNVVEVLRPGGFAGIALAQDESAVLVSALQPYRNRAQVLIVDVNTLETSASTAGVGENPDAGGLHRARNRGLFAWVDQSGGGGRGRVYRVGP